MPLAIAPRNPPPAPSGPAAAAIQTQQPPRDSELDRVIKLIPAEVVTLYATALSFGPQVDSRWFAPILTLLGTILVPVILYLDERANPGRVQLAQYVLRTLAFLAWAFAISDPLSPTIVVARWIPGLFVLALPIIGSRVLK